MLIDLWAANDKYGRQKARARQRGIEFDIEFDDWMNIWLESGYWNQRGNGRGKYNMSRIDDAGAYEVGNVFIQTHEQNSSDGHKGIAQSVDHILKNRAAQQTETTRLKRTEGLKRWWARRKEQELS